MAVGLRRHGLRGGRAAARGVRIPWGGSAFVVSSRLWSSFSSAPGSVPRRSARIRRTSSYAARASAEWPTRPQRADQLGVERFVERMVRDELAQLRYDVRRAVEREIGVDPAVQRGQPERLGAGGGRVPVRQVGKGRAAPQGERLTEGGGGRPGVVGVQGADALVRQPLEAEQVDVVLGVAVARR